MLFLREIIFILVFAFIPQSLGLDLKCAQILKDNVWVDSGKLLNISGYVDSRLLGEGGTADVVLVKDDKGLRVLKKYRLDDSEQNEVRHLIKTDVEIMNIMTLIAADAKIEDLKVLDYSNFNLEKLEVELEYVPGESLSRFLSRLRDPKAKEVVIERFRELQKRIGDALRRRPEIYNLSSEDVIAEPGLSLSNEEFRFFPAPRPYRASIIYL
jgi:hypothetical protein